MIRDLIILMLLFCCGYSVNAYNDAKQIKITQKIEQKHKKIVEKTKKHKKSSKKTITHVTLTCYQPVASQCNEDFLHTADNSPIDLKKLKKGHIKWVAISQDLLWLIPIGSKVRISDEQTGKFYGIYTVKDKMNKRWEHRMDILIHPSSNERIYAENIKIEVV